jgi:hypothetical protein
MEISECTVFEFCQLLRACSAGARGADLPVALPLLPGHLFRESMGGPPDDGIPRMAPFSRTAERFAHRSARTTQVRGYNRPSSVHDIRQISGSSSAFGPPE